MSTEMPSSPEPETQSEAGFISAKLSQKLRLLWPKGARWGLVTLFLVTIGLLLVDAFAALQPFVIGLVFAYVLLPVVNYLHRYFPRWVSITMVYVASFLLILTLFAYVIPILLDQTGQLLRSTPTVEELEGQAKYLFAEYQRTVPLEVREPINSWASDSLKTLQTNFTAYMQGLGKFLFSSALQVISTVSSVLGFLIIPIWIFFVLNDQRSALLFIDHVVPRTIRVDFWAIIRIIDRILINYVRGQVILGITVGIGVGLGLSLLRLAGIDVKYVFLLAFIAGLTELVPVVGPLIGAIPAVVLSLLDSPITGLAVALLYLLVQVVENNFLVPRIIGESLGLHPALFIVLLVIGGEAFGIVGMILTAPVSAIVRDIFIYLHGRLSEPPWPAGLLPGESEEKDLRPQKAT